MVWGCTLSRRLEDIASFHMWEERWRHSCLNAYRPQTGWAPKPGCSVLQQVQGVARVSVSAQGPCLLTNVSSLDLPTCQPNILYLGMRWNHFSGFGQRKHCCVRTPEISALSHKQFELLAYCIRELLLKGENCMLGGWDTGQVYAREWRVMRLEHSSHVVVRYLERSRWSRSSQGWCQVW